MSRYPRRPVSASSRWRGERDSLAYAFPTHDGPRRKRDLPQAELEQIRQTIRASLAARAPLDRRFDGERASLLLHARPLPLRAAREDSARLGRELARADRLAALGRMAAGLVHEIGNPLAAMRLRSENGLSAADPDRARAALGAVLGQIGRLEELLGGLRLLTRTAEVRPQPVRLLPFLQARLEEVRPMALPAGVSLALEPAPAADASWRFDERSLARALDNLLLNALQHTPAGGRVTLGAEVGGGGCRFRVTDTGPGVKPSPVAFRPA